jgi:hypothetical protein
MKKILLFALLVAFTTMGYAQSDKNADKPKEATPKVDATIKKSIPKMKSRDRLIIELTHDNWLNKPDYIETKWFSRGFNAFVMWDVPLVKSGIISVAPGLGISNTNVFSNVLIQSSLSDDSTHFNVIPTSVPNLTTTVENDSVALKYSKNKLTVSSIDIPLELRFRTNPSKGKPFKLAIGARVGYVINAHTKYKGEDYRDGSQREVTLKEAPAININRLKYGVTGRIGYGNFNIFGYYSLSKLFNTSLAPEITPISVGISFNSF